MRPPLRQNRTALPSPATSQPAASSGWIAPSESARKRPPWIRQARWPSNVRAAFAGSSEGGFSWVRMATRRTERCCGETRSEFPQPASPTPRHRTAAEKIPDPKEKGPFSLVLKRTNPFSATAVFKSQTGIPQVSTRGRLLRLWRRGISLLSWRESQSVPPSLDSVPCVQPG